MIILVFLLIISFGIALEFLTLRYYAKALIPISILIICLCGLVPKSIAFIRHGNNAQHDWEQKNNAWIAACHAKGGKEFDTRDGRHCISKQFLLDD
jgi:hypothetical protein